MSTYHEGLPTVVGVNYSPAYYNKERVFYTPVGGQAVYLEIKGYNVTADYAGCGTNSMRVWYTWFYEDNDRDDGNGPSWNPGTGMGVQPE